MFRYITCCRVFSFRTVTESDHSLSLSFAVVLLRRPKMDPSKDNGYVPLVPGAPITTSVASGPAAGQPARYLADLPTSGQVYAMHAIIEDEFRKWDTSVEAKITDSAIDSWRKSMSVCCVLCVVCGFAFVFLSSLTHSLTPLLVLPSCRSKNRTASDSVLFTG